MDRRVYLTVAAAVAALFLVGVTPAGAETVVFPGAVTADLCVFTGPGGETLVAAATEDRFVRAWTWEGKMVWEANVQRRTRALLAAPDGTLVAIDTRGGFARITPGGEVAAAYRSIRPLATGLLHLDGRGAVRTVDGRRVTAVGPGGTELWSVDLPAEAESVASVGDWTWYRTKAGELVSITADAEGSRHRAWVSAGPLIDPASGMLIVTDERGAIAVVDGDGRNGWRSLHDTALEPVASGSAGFVARRENGTLQLFGWDGTPYSATSDAVPSDAHVSVVDGGCAVVVDPAGAIVRLAAGGAAAVGSAGSGVGGASGQRVVVAPDGRALVRVDDSWRADFVSLDDQWFAVSAPPSANSGPSGDKEISRSAFGAVAFNIIAEPGRAERGHLVSGIAERIDTGRLFGTLRDVTDVLGALVTEPYRRPIRLSGVVENDYPEIRIAAARQLGRILDEPSRAFLADCARRDPDPAVTIAAFDALVPYGYDRDATIARVAGQRFSRLSRVDRERMAPTVVRVATMAGSGAEANSLLEAVAASDVERRVRVEALRVMRDRAR